MESDDNKRWRETKASLEAEPLTLGPYFSFIARKTPRRLLHLLSYYKFASRMIGANKRVVDVGCSEGFGTTIVAEASKSCLGVDLDADAIATATQTVGSDRLRFEVRDIIAKPLPECDAIVTLDTIEHIPRENEDAYVRALADALSADGICIIGTPNETSDKYASPWTRAGHINLFSADRLRELGERHFRNVFSFSANDEVVHTGFAPMAHYLIALCAGPKRT
ncbi:MAG: class I SAM-dependent methyltransferase [Vulcanimicrobiaceae bacterium]|jgi:2-polyprenyl-3-methyl-5-hydroxy-6-metoxy-1,4-benzoquinol methylase